MKKLFFVNFVIAIVIFVLVLLGSDPREGEALMLDVQKEIVRQPSSGIFTAIFLVFCGLASALAGQMVSFVAKSTIHRVVVFVLVSAGVSGVTAALTSRFLVNTAAI